MGVHILSRGVSTPQEIDLHFVARKIHLPAPVKFGHASPHLDRIRSIAVSDVRMHF